jgi:glycosyltransferase involved in cell wall biosynthesis
MPFFSIVIPTYNRADMLENTISSIKKQTFTDWECIIIDDGSTDHTNEVVKDLIENEPKIKYVFQTNAERSAARNNGISHSRGTYICFLDSDDSFLEHHLQCLYDKIKTTKNSIALFFTNYILFNDNTFLSQKIEPLESDVIHYLFNNPIIPARVCIHSSILLKEKFDEDIIIVEDLLLWVKISQNYPLIHIEEDTIIYNLHDDNSVNIKNKSAQHRLNGLKVFQKRYPQITGKITPEIWNNVIGETHFGLTKYFLFANKNKLAFKHLLLSIFYQKLHPQLKHKILIAIKLILHRPIAEYK